MNYLILIHLAESFVFAAIRYAVKNPQHAEEVKQELLGLRDAIDEQFPEAKKDGAPVK